tara:strand:- start:5485 stop:5697 length:213 start_codon:yes stop_codon:yes gene_type:complete
MYQNKNNLIGRKEIARYAGCSVWTVSAMIKAGLQCSGGGVKGKPAITKKEFVDEFFIDNPKFIARDYLIK